MILDKRITVATPVLNESFFIDGWLRNVVRIADEVVITDGGSTDGTWESLVAKAWATSPETRWYILRNQQSGEPYSTDWNEGAVRNEMLARCTGDYVVLLDADEQIETQSVDTAVWWMEHTGADIAYLRWVTFWGDQYHVRVNTWRDRHWNGCWIPRVARVGAVHYDKKRHHCRLRGRRRIRVNVPIFHLHYAYGPARLKANDNRRFDFTDHPVMKPVVREYRWGVPE